MICALHIALQEALLVVGEQLVAIEAIGQRREAAARHPGDDADGIEQADLFAIRPDDLGAPKELQDAIGKGGRARSAAGKGENDQRVRVLEMRLPRRETVADVRVGLRDRRIDRPRRATAESEQREQQRRQETAPADQCSRPEKIRHDLSPPTFCPLLPRKKSVLSLSVPMTRPSSLMAKNGSKATKMTSDPASNSWKPLSRKFMTPAARPSPIHSPLIACSTIVKATTRRLKRTVLYSAGIIRGLSSRPRPRRKTDRS